MLIGILGHTQSQNRHLFIARSLSRVMFGSSARTRANREACPIGSYAVVSETRSHARPGHRGWRTAEDEGQGCGPPTQALRVRRFESRHEGPPAQCASSNGLPS
jgi:hypothetical protein